MRVPPFLLLSASLLAPLGAQADGGIYRYVEKDGTIVYTNVPPAGAKKASKLKGTFSEAPEPNAPVRGRSRTPQEFEAHILAASARGRAITPAESTSNPPALSNKGPSGLMQLMPATASEMYVRDIFDSRDNIEGGVRYLRVLANLFEGDMVKMVAAYNAGPDAVRKYGGQVPPYAETQAYVRKVLQLYQHYKERERLTKDEPREMDSDGDNARDGAGAEEPR